MTEKFGAADAYRAVKAGTMTEEEAINRLTGQQGGSVLALSVAVALGTDLTTVKSLLTKAREEYPTDDQSHTWDHLETQLMAESHPAGELDRVNLKITLEFDNKRYTHVQWGLRDGYQYQWEEGNNACDCNRSLYIRRFNDPDFPSMGCGDRIALSDIEKTDEPESVKLPIWGDRDPIDDPEEQ